MNRAFFTLLAMFPAIASADVLLVGTYHGVPGQFDDVQAAVDAAHEGDFILIAPGDWHPQGNGGRGGVYVTTPNLTIRGMDRNATIIDGTAPGTSTPCSSDPAAQLFGPNDENGQPEGRNGVWVYRVSGVVVENMTVCNFLSGSGDSGNQVYFDGEEDEKPIVLHSWYGAYLTASSSYFDTDHYGVYGIFTSTSDGPGAFVHTYASNMADSGYYIGACPNCNAVIDDAHAQNNSLGYSGTNSGGNLIIENSEWDNNNSGIITNTQSVGDPPPPQDGACPNGGTGPTGTTNCWVLRNNFIHDNNNPNVPKVGLTAEGPVGTGLVIAGGRNDIVMDNLIINNGAWGVLVTVFPDVPEPAGGAPAPPPDQYQQPDCSQGTNVPEEFCLFNAFGNEIAGNTFLNNGFFGNVTNGDVGELSDPATPGNCWHDNVDLSGPFTSEPLLIQTTHGTCGIPNSGDPLTSPLGFQVACDTQALFDCPTTVVANYPRATAIQMMPIPSHEPTMPDPCAGVPANPWCSGSSQSTTPAAAAPPRFGGAMSWSTLAVLLVLLLPRSLRAQDESDPHAAQPERPTIATHAHTVAPGWIETEDGVEVDRYADGPRGVVAPIYFKLGLAPRFQLGVQWPLISPPDEHTTGFGDVTLGLKWRLLDDAPIVGDFAILPTLKLPTGSQARDTGTGTTDAGLLLISSHQFGGVSMDVNAGYTHRSGDGSVVPRNATLWTVSFGGPVHAQFGWTAEVFGYPATSGPSGESSIVALLAGPTWQARKWLVLDAGLITPLTGPQPRAVYAGLTWNVGRVW